MGTELPNSIFINQDSNLIDSGEELAFGEGEKRLINFASESNCSVFPRIPSIKLRPTVENVSSIENPLNKKIEELLASGNVPLARIILNSTLFINDEKLMKIAYVISPPKFRVKKLGEIKTLDDINCLKKKTWAPDSCWIAIVNGEIKSSGRKLSEVSEDISPEDIPSTFFVRV